MVAPLNLQVYMVSVSPYQSQSDSSDSDAHSNYMSISSSSGENVSTFSDDNEESGASDVELPEIAPSTFRGFLGRASEVLFPNVSSFFSNANESQDEDNIRHERRGFSAFSNISATLSDVFRPLAPSALFSQILRVYPGSMMRRSESQKTQLNTSGKGLSFFNG